MGLGILKKMGKVKKGYLCITSELSYVGQRRIVFVVKKKIGKHDILLNYSHKKKKCLCPDSVEGCRLDGKGTVVCSFVDFNNEDIFNMLVGIFKDINEIGVCQFYSYEKLSGPPKRRGNPGLEKVRNSDTGNARRENIKRADEFNADVFEIIASISGVWDMSLREICSYLNKEGIRTRVGGWWYPQSVKRLLEKCRS